jgi:SAM-dependent methyltransferase
MIISYSTASKYEIVARALRGQEGNLLDIGARDRALEKFIDLKRIKYHSADVQDGHDFKIDLEEKLPFENGYFDFVVALDVLEHVNKIHNAFQELARVTRAMLIVALPNMASLHHRLVFMAHGKLGTDKYDLLPEPRADRHHWLTVYAGINRFASEIAPSAGLKLEKSVEVLEPGRYARMIGLGGTKLGLFKNGLFTARCIYFYSRLSNIKN